MKNSILIFSFIILLGNFLSAADSSSIKNINSRSLGGSIFSGIPLYKLPEGTRYAPVLFLINYHQPFFKAKKFFNAGIDFSPQIGFATGRLTGLEAGLNISLALCFAIRNSSVISLQAGSGPHYLSYPTSRQAKGFLFANYFLLQYRKRITKKVELNFYSGFRHISNANLETPNGGINNAIIGIGMSRLW